MYSENPLLFFVGMPLITTWFLLDIIRKISIKLRLFAVPNERSSHDKIIPATGGVALCISWLFIIFINVLFSGNEYHTELYFYGIAGVIITIIGFYDDLNEIPSYMKLLMQIFVFYIITFGEHALITSFHGLFGIYELSEIESIIFSLFVFIVIVNSINLVDGIDGLSASLSLYFILITAYFYFIYDYYYYGLLISFCFSLMVFIIFNTSKSKKIFLGDTGSLGLGLTVAVLSLGWLNTNHPLSDLLPLNHSLFVVLILAYPLLDVIRIFIIRSYNGKSFMSADRNHIHHKLIDIGLSHKLAVFIILLTQSIILVFNILVIPEINLHYQILINAVIITGLLLYLYRIPNKI